MSWKRFRSVCWPSLRSAISPQRQGESFVISARLALLLPIVEQRALLNRVVVEQAQAGLQPAQLLPRYVRSRRMGAVPQRTQSGSATSCTECAPGAPLHPACPRRASVQSSRSSCSSCRFASPPQVPSALGNVGVRKIDRLREEAFQPLHRLPVSGRFQVTDNLLERAAATPAQNRGTSLRARVEAARESWPCSYPGPTDRHPGRANDWSRRSIPRRWF